MLSKDSPMKFSAAIITNLKIKEAKNKVNKAGEKALKDTITDIAEEVITIHPWKNVTGNNSRSIKYEVKGLSGAVYSTSGYGGYLETGTSRMAARPYFKPALDRNIHKLPEGIKAELK